jgi:hypothetical protein
VLIGFFIFVAFLFSRYLIKQHVIGPLPRTLGYRTLRAILLYGFIIGFLVISLGFGLVYLKSIGISKTSQQPRRLSTGERVHFVQELMALQSSREEIRLGCAAGSEDTCVLAGQFLDLFQEAGWIVRGDSVERAQLGKPRAGVVLMKRGVTQTPPPAGSGVWVLQTPSLECLKRAFSKIGMSPELASDAKMPEGVVGVFIGPSL